MEVNSFLNNQILTVTYCHICHMLLSHWTTLVHCGWRQDKGLKELQITEDPPRGCLSFLGIVIDSILTCFGLNMCCKIYYCLLLFFSCSFVSDSLQPHWLQHARPPCPSPMQTHVHRVGDAIQPSHPLPSSFPPAFYPSQHQGLLGLFQWVGSLCQVAKVLEHQFQHQSFRRVFIPMSWFL